MERIKRLKAKRLKLSKEFYGGKRAEVIERLKEKHKSKGLRLVIDRQKLRKLEYENNVMDINDEILTIKTSEFWRYNVNPFTGYNIRQ